MAAAAGDGARKRRRVARLLAVPVAGFLGGLLFLHAFSRLTYEAGALRVGLEVSLGTPGRSVLAVPPLGEIRARTHPLPLELRATLWSLDMDLVRTVVSPQGPAEIEDLLSGLRQEARRVLGLLAGQALLLGIGGGAVAAAVLGRRAWADLGRAAAWGGLGAGLLVGGTYLLYDPAAFDRPEYRGIVEAAPWMVNTVREAARRVEELGVGLQHVARNLYLLFENLDDLPELGRIEAPLTALHVSDIHNHVAALDFIEGMIARFGVDVVLDTGDLTDWGTPLEAGLTARIQALGLPYVFVPGNHESPAVLARLAQTPGVVLLTGEPREVAGLRLLGIPDPGARGPSPAALTPAAAQDLAAESARLLAAQNPPPDLLLVHNHRVAEAIPPGLVPAVLFGHDHRLRVEERNGTVYVNAGSTGAAGIRGLTGEGAVPFSLALLYFRPGGDGRPRLAAVDTVRVFTLPARRLILERFVVEPPEPAPAPPAQPPARGRPEAVSPLPAGPRRAMLRAGSTAVLTANRIPRATFGAG